MTAMPKGSDRTSLGPIDYQIVWGCLYIYYNIDPDVPYSLYKEQHMEINNDKFGI